MALPDRQDGEVRKFNADFSVRVKQDESLPADSNISASMIALTVDNTAHVQLKVGASNLTDRKKITIANQGGNITYIGPNNTFTANKTNAFSLNPGNSAEIEIGDLISMYARTNSGSTTLIVMEEA